MGLPHRGSERDARRQDGRRRRYDLRSVLWGVSGLDRVCGCGRWRRADVPAVEVRQRPDGSAYFYGVQSCGSVWACPTCGPKIRQRRADEIRGAVLRHLDEGGGVLTQVLTVPHDAGDELGHTFDTVAKGWQRVQSGKGWQALRAELGLVGTVRAVEVTHGRNGWHPHVHVLYFLDAPPHACTAARLESHVYRVWGRFVEGRGLRRPMEKWCRVERVREAADLAGYLAKVTGEGGWDLPLEMTRSDLKVGKRSERGRTPWEILDAFARTGDAAELALWLEFERVSHGRRALTWSRGLKARCGVGEVSDEELAEERQDGATVAMLTAEEWVILTRRRGALCELLEAAERGDPAEVRVLVGQLVEAARAGPSG